MSEDQRLWAVRGATSVGRNDADLIVSGTEELMRQLLERNDLDVDRIVSCIFTSTHDLNAEFPAVAARNMGLNQVPLLCGQEIDVPNSMRGVVRVLLHYYAPHDHTPSHTYLGEAQKLRSDLGGAQ
jgi:chorismate mutase